METYCASQKYRHSQCMMLVNEVIKVINLISWLIVIMIKDNYDNNKIKKEAMGC